MTDTTFVSRSYDKTLKFWNVENIDAIRFSPWGDEIICCKNCTFEGHTNGVQCVAALTDTTFVSGSWDMTLKLWNVENNHAIRTFQGHTSSVYCVAKCNPKNEMHLKTTGPIEIES